MRAGVNIIFGYVVGPLAFGVCLNRKGHFVDTFFIIGVCGGVLGACGTVAKFPKDVVIVGVDLGLESDGFVGAVFVGALFWDWGFVHRDLRAEVYGLRANHVGIAFGHAETVDMGVEPLAALHMMHPVLDVLAGEGVVTRSYHILETVGRQ